METRMLFNVSQDGALIAQFGHIDHAEKYAEKLPGVAEVTSKGDGYVYFRFVDGVYVRDEA